MIHFIKEGEYKRIGLNIMRTKGGFVLGWVWYDVRNHELYGWRFRFRAHMKPRIIFKRERQSVVKSFLTNNELMVVQRTLLEDQAPWVYALMKAYDEAARRQDGLDMKPRV